MQIKSISLENFKGVKDRNYSFGKYTRISGMNRLGKTTIATAWYWLTTDKDYDLHSNPNIRPDNVEECIPTVTAVLDVDGKEITIAKMQKRKVSKPNSEGVSKVTLTNTYSINEVPKTERDFKAYLEDLGLVFDNFLVCSHPNVFTNQKTADMRKMLFKMASEKSDYDIAAMSKETADVAKLLSDYKYEEIEAMQKASKKKAVEQVEAIPNQIIGLEKAKVDVDTAEHELAKADLERRIAEIDEKISNSGNAVSDLMSEEMQLQMDMSVIMQNMNKELSDKRRELENDKYEVRQQLANATGRINELERQIATYKTAIETAEKKRFELGAKYKAAAERTFDESKWVFDENSTICSLCGQTLPEDKIAEIKADFENRKEKAKDDFMVQKNSDMEEIKAQGFKQKGIIEDLTAKNTSLLEDISNLKTQEQTALEKQSELSKQLEELPAEADYSQNEEYVKLKARHDEVKSKIESMKSSTDVADTFKQERKVLVDELEAVKAEIAKAFNNVHIDEQIVELQEKQRDYEQAKADAEKILYQLSLVSRKKNELLVEEINNHFGIVKWLLFDYQKNGEYKEVCIPTVDGKRFGESTNTGREIEAKLDICNSFQKFFGMELPIFLDKAESLNDCYMPKLDCQLITLKVRDALYMDDSGSIHTKGELLKSVVDNMVDKDGKPLTEGEKVLIAMSDPTFSLDGYTCVDDGSLKVEVI